MTSKQQREWQELCVKAVKEPDPEKQAAIVAELNRMLHNQAKRAHSAAPRGVLKQRSA